ncbi:zinc ribbon domain-containing protein [Methanobrevibacter sp.]|uniref:zinc ribbon domain-containing protein n=1 Tax=Methanobrevibacter sp. TaxID=66852 RepID=UPI00386C5E8C
MKCSSCGFENRDDAKFCTKCGKSMIQKVDPISHEVKSSNSKYIIAALVIVIILLVAVIGYFAYSNMNSDNASSAQVAQSTQEVSSSQSSPTTTQQSSSKSWQVIGSYSGSGSGSKTINVPSGQIRVELSAYPIKNYATNYLYVSGSNGAGGGVDWNSHSDVETRSDSFEYTSSSSQTFTIDYYETVSWEVTFYSYQ